MLRRVRISLASTPACSVSGAGAEEKASVLIDDVVYQIRI